MLIVSLLFLILLYIIIIIIDCTWNSTNGLCVETANGLCDNHGGKLKHNNILDLILLLLQMMKVV